MTEYTWQKFEKALDRRLKPKNIAPRKAVRKKDVEAAAREKRVELALQTWSALSARQQNAVVRSLDLDRKSLFNRKSLKRQNAFMAAINLLLALK